MSRIYINKKIIQKSNNKHIIISMLTSDTYYSYYDQEITKCIDNLYNKLVNLSEGLVKSILDKYPDSLIIDFEKNEAIIK